MAKSKLKIMGVHGLGDHRTSPWKEDWQATISKVFGQHDKELEFGWITYDDIFEGIDLTLWQSMAAVGKLLTSSVKEAFGARKRGFLDSTQHALRWYAGYVVAWVENAGFQQQTRQRVAESLKQFQPDLLLAHSLGSLVTYNALSSPEFSGNTILGKVSKNLTYVTLGSQIGNPFVVRNLTPGRIAPLDVQKWIHLYNEEDDVFTAEIRLPAANNFEQVETYFDIEGIADHDALEYLKHRNTVNQVWLPFINQLAGVKAKSFSSVARTLTKPPARSKRQPRKRAVLVGINEYPDPAARLDGCVNDVFLMSSVLQECGFEPEQIRLCLNERATAQGIIDRFKWLVEDPQPDDELVFYFSGHGTQLPAYGDEETVDSLDESLVPCDFDWTPERAITDDQIFELYSQLPYQTHLALIFDCCHSGGMHRSGSNKSRSLEPPDDIRHRTMRWNSKFQMWEARDLKPLNRDFTKEDDVAIKYAGKDGSTKRLGRAMSLRSLKSGEYTRMVKKSKGPVGPYLPLILEACQESEEAIEYRDGNESFGAFTFTLAKALRQSKGITFQKLVQEVQSRLHKLRYKQSPQILGPTVVVKAAVPWLIK
jgi:metacaspase-1